MTRADALALAFGGALIGALLTFGLAWAPLTLLTAAFGLLLADGVARPQSPWLLPIVTRGPKAPPRVALTFDDGPDPEVTPRILDALAAAGAKATFFCVAQRLEAHPELARRVVAEGHELANHSDRHPRTLNLWSPAAMQAEIERAAAVVTRLGGRGRLYRPPMGLKSPPLAKVARAMDLEVVLWSVHGGDTRGASAEEITTRVLARVEAGSIVLLHDGGDRGQDRSETARALPMLLRELRLMGLEVVTVGALRGASR